ncbi:MAG: SurA N-terminal domain-containing protein [Thermodesulfobacteriota bacterium]
MTLMATRRYSKHLSLFYLQVWWAALTLVFGSWAMGAVRADVIVDRIVAVVNNEVITYLELQGEIGPYEEKIKSMGYDEEKELQTLFKVREDIIHRLIDEKLADQAIEKNNISVSEAEIDATIERLKASRMWSDEDLRKALEAEGMTMQDLRHTMRNQALRNQLIGKEVSSKIVVTTEEVQAYYDRHAEEYQGELLYHLRNIIVMVPSEEDGGRPAARNKIEKIMQKLNDGESFESLAHAFSESSLSEKGGDLGKIRYDDFSPLIKTALEGLGQGDYTGILDTDRGYQIFFVEDVSKEGGKRFEEVSPEIEEKLYNAAVDKKYGEWLEELKRQAHIKIIR